MILDSWGWIYAISYGNVLLLLFLFVHFGHWVQFLETTGDLLLEQLHMAEWAGWARAGCLGDGIGLFGFEVVQRGALFCDGLFETGHWVATTSQFCEDVG